MKILQPAPDVFLKVAKVSNSFIELEEGISPMSQVQSGEWFPSITDIDASNPIVSVIRANYSRVGSIVTCSLFLDVTMGTGATQCIFGLSLPIPSVFAFVKDAFGIIAYNGGTPTELESWNIKAKLGSNEIAIELQSTTAEFNYQYLYAVLQYVII
jgi:hypothetical protein